jgi:hypothetical protein
MEAGGDWKLPWEGGCRCGAVRFRISAPPLMSAVCHCRGCQQMTGSAFTTTLFVPDEGFALIDGEVVPGGTGSPGVRHQHCDRCKSWVFTVAEPSMGFTNVRATLLDDAGWFVPFIETQTAEKLPWVSTPAVHSYDRFPAPPEFPGLIAEHAERGARPLAAPAAAFADTLA